MHWGDVWDLMFRSFLVFIFFGLLWLKYVDPFIPCLFGLPVPIALGVVYFYWGWRKAKIAWLKEEAKAERTAVRHTAPDELPPPPVAAKEV
jgi:hypothetical protein